MELALNILVSVLLVITILFCIRLSRRISTFNSSKVELAKFIEEFNKSIAKAESNINGLKAMGAEVDENLKSQIKKARFLANDLSFLAEKGESVANNLDDKILISRDIYKKIITESSREGVTPKVKADSQSSVKRPPSNASQQNNANWLKSGRRATGVNTNESSSPSQQQQSTAGTGQSQMSPSKKRALDALLKEIAKKKGNIS
jgi:hypothetical protein